MVNREDGVKGHGGEVSMASAIHDWWPKSAIILSCSFIAIVYSRTCFTGH
jgi:hypothetical protein